MGFFAEAGPLQVFVSNYVRSPAMPRPAQPHAVFAPKLPRLTRCASAAQLIPEDMSFQAIDEPCYVSSDEMARALHADMRFRTCGPRPNAARPRVAGAHSEGERGPPAHRGHAQRRQRNRACSLAARALLRLRLTCFRALQFCVGTIKDNYLGLIGEAQV
jgi:hypothetical protein